MICCSHISAKKLTENNLEMYYDLFTVEKSQDIRLQPSFWGKLVRFSTMISREECPFSGLAPSRSSKSAAVRLLNPDRPLNTRSLNAELAVENFLKFY